MLKACLPLMISSVSLSSLLYAQDSASLFHFFGGKDIDYWHEGKEVKKNPTFKQKENSKIEAFNGSNILRHGDSKKFNWEVYQDPSAPEFWDDGGDWIPPRPFREAAANPTPENIKNYLDWMSAKGMVVTRFQNALARSLTPDEPESPLPWGKLEIKYFYQSSCPHCKNSVPIVHELINRGVKFSFIQLDAGDLPPLHVPSQPYTPPLKEAFPVSVTPTWYLRHGKDISKITGALSLTEISQFFKTLLHKEGDL